MTTQAKKSENIRDDLLMILATRFTLANAINQDQFLSSIQLDVKKPKTYACAMQGPNAAEWARAIEEKLT